jgi:hypothetical protein
MPLLVIEQYRKNEGRMVEVIASDGTREKGMMMNVTEGGFDLSIDKKEKKKETVTVLKPYNFEDVKSVKVIISFK